MQFNVTILGVATGRLLVAISNSKNTEQEGRHDSYCLAIYMFKITTFDMITGIIDV